jgi:transcriptional regulator GlxA family with amidase domain
MLARSDRSVTKIAYASGFQDMSNFIRSFKREFSLALSRYRAVAPSRRKV